MTDDNTLNLARTYIASLAEGIDPGAPPALNGFSEQITVLREAFDDGGSDAIARAFESLSRHNPKYELLRPALLAKKAGKAAYISGVMQPLPESAQLPAGLSNGACLWLESFIRTMTGVVPSNFAKLDGIERAKAERSIAFSGQRSWFLDEFEQFISGMKKKNGHMHEYSGMMRELDRGEDEYTLTTIGRGEDKVDKPYLSLLANVTPSDLKTAAKKGSEEWGNGFWARVAVIGPNAEEPLRKGRMPNEKFQAPTDILEPLLPWNER